MNLIVGREYCFNGGEPYEYMGKTSQNQHVFCSYERATFFCERDLAVMNITQRATFRTVSHIYQSMGIDITKCEDFSPSAKYEKREFDSIGE